jgi:hypothetical protein
MKKTFKIREEDIVLLISGGGSCLATDRITVDGCELGYMYREVTDREGDTGWRFFSGDEPQDYIDDLSHSDVYAINTLANYEPAILAYLDTPPPCTFERLPGGRKFRQMRSKLWWKLW